MPFYFFCLVIGILVGAILTWFLIADHPFESREAPGGPVDPLESGLLASQMADAGTPLDEQTVTRLLQLHGAYVMGRIHDEEAKGEAPGSDGEASGEAGTEVTDTGEATEPAG